MQGCWSAGVHDPPSTVQGRWSAEAHDPPSMGQARAPWRGKVSYTYPPGHGIPPGYKARDPMQSSEGIQQGYSTGQDINPEEPYG